MKINSIKVENFKAIKEAIVELADVTILVGQNSSGKSSFLQALHWACRCVADARIQNNQARSVSVQSLDYYPTPEAKVVGNNSELREARGDQADVSVRVTLNSEANGELITAAIPIKKGRNDAIQIDLLKEKKIPLSLYKILSDRKRPFSAYIPGLAGIPSGEEKKSRQPVFRSAASGDANAVLRNILLMIQQKGEGELEILEKWVSTVLGKTRLKISFEDGDSFHIQALINTEKMKDGYWSPLELSGTGVLQVTQIFSYLILFKPYLLLIDEPDAHLHPDRQEALIRSIETASQDFQTQIIITTHSPHVIRTASQAVKLAWLKDGGVLNDDRKIREEMGWGLLDKSILIITEDQNTPTLQNIINQWPAYNGKIAVWPVYGSENLPSAEGACSLKKILGISKLIIHRDGDFMVAHEKGILKSRFQGSGCELWITDGSDIEAYLCTPEHLSQKLEITNEEAKDIIERAADATFDNKLFEEKRSQINKKNSFYPNGAGTPSNEAVKEELKNNPGSTCIGKKMLKRIKVDIHQTLKKDGKVLLDLEVNGRVALDLKVILDA